MRVAIICPIPLLRRYGELSGYHLALAPLVLKHKAYRDFYRAKSKNGEFVILDNGVIEFGQPVSMDDLKRAAELVGPTEVVIPDFLRDAQRTVESLVSFMDDPFWEGESAVFIPQGETFPHWMWALGFGLAYRRFVSEFKTLGIPKLVESSYKRPRPHLIEELYASEVLTSGMCDVHLFGVHSNPIEILQYNGTSIRGIDMKFPIWAGQCGIPIDPDFGLSRKQVVTLLGKQPHLDFLSDTDNEIVEANVRTVLEWGRVHDQSLQEVKR